MLPYCKGKLGNPFPGMTSIWDKFIFGINQMRIVGKTMLYFTLTDAMVLFKICCHVIDATFAKQNPILQGNNL